MCIERVGRVEQPRLAADARAAQLDAEERKLLFREYIAELEEKEAAARAAEREARRLLERAKRDELKAALDALVGRGEVRPCPSKHTERETDRQADIYTSTLASDSAPASRMACACGVAQLLPNTRFRDVEAMMTALPEWTAATEVLGAGKAREVYDATADELKAALEEDVKVVRAAGAASQVPLTLATTADAWYDAVQASDRVDEAVRASVAVIKERKPLYFALAFKVRPRRPHTAHDAAAGG
jgi:hypothetical protein